MKNKINNKNNLKKQYLKIFLMSIMIIILDQVSKFIITKNIDYQEKVTVIKDFFYLTNEKNIGGAFSILEGGQLFIIAISIVFFVIILNMIRREKDINTFFVIVYSFIIGGVVGNLIDRLVNNYVIDFLSFEIFSKNMPIFNLADLFIVIGFILMILSEVFISGRRNNS